MPPHGFQFAGGMSLRRMWQGEATMAIVRSREGSFFDVPDEELKKYEKKAEDVQGCSAEAGQEQGPGGPGGGGGGGASPVQIIVNYAGGMGGGGQGAPSGGGSGDVKGRYCGHWHNCWRNCWRNYWRNFGW